MYLQSFDFNITKFISEGVYYKNIFFGDFRIKMKKEKKNYIIF